MEGVREVEMGRDRERWFERKVKYRDIKRGDRERREIWRDRDRKKII